MNRLLKAIRNVFSDWYYRLVAILLLMVVIGELNIWHILSTK